MRKLLSTAVLLLFTATMALAIPAKRIWRTVTQPDGTQLRVMLVGDERLHYFVTEDSVPVLESNNAYYYADGIGFGMKRSNLLAHNAGQRTALEVKTAKAASVNRIEQMRPFTRQNLFRPSRPLSMRRAEADSSSVFYTSDHRDITGEHKSIVILCEFPNRKFLANHDSTYFWNMVNEEGYTNEQGAIGSIHDYFKDQSHGQLDLVFDVVGPIEMDYNYSHYGGSQYSGNDDNGWEFAYEALNKVHEQYPNLNWHDYDWDGDGEVENLYFIYAGYGQATGGSSSTLWPAQTNFDDYNAYYGGRYGYPTYNVNFDGVKINTFAYGNELYGGSGSTPQGMGTMTHEFSHCLGFPDLYNTDYSGAADMGSWSIMASGSYGGPNGIGWVPTGYTAYEKWAAGWIDYKNFAEMNDTIKGLKSTYNGGDAYVVYNDRLLSNQDPDAQEYFLFENRTQNRWDTYLPAQGLEVMHVNYSKSIWDGNSVNTPSSRYGGNSRSNMIVVTANNSTSTYDESGNLFPYNTRSGIKDSITVNSNPSLTFYNAQADGTTKYAKPIYNIRWNAADSTVSFLYNPVDTMFTPAPSISASPLVYSSQTARTSYFRDSTIVTITASLGAPRYSIDNKQTWNDYTVPFTIYDDSTTVYTYAWREGKDTSAIDSALFVKQKRLEAPVITADTTFINSTRVTITGPATGGRIYYAIGATSTNFRTYSRPLTISASTVIRAFAGPTSYAYMNSDTVSIELRKLEVCAPPTIALNEDSSAIALTTDVDGGHIWFSTDSATFNEYLTPIDITDLTDTIRVWAYVAAEGKVTSDTVSFTYVAPQPIADAIRSVTINGMTGRVSIYTLGGQKVLATDRAGAVSLRPGVYLVRDEKGKTRKITVK